MLMRLDKILSAAGIASRSGSKALFRAGRVTVNGAPASSGAGKCDPETCEIRVDGAPVVYREHYYIMMNKPEGYLSATEDGRDRVVTELLDPNLRARGLFPAGRLDKDSVGLLILTDDGDFCHRVISPKSGVIKTYLAECSAPIPDFAPRRFAEGLTLGENMRCLPAELRVSPSDPCLATVRLQEGKFHQVKRMLAAVGSPVVSLKRVSEGGLSLDEALAPGQWRELRKGEKELILLGGEPLHLNI
jgi:16S rRNA pseudouridine516 synthase